MVREMQGAPGSLYPTATYLTGPRGPECRVDETKQGPQGEGYYLPLSYGASGQAVNPNHADGTPFGTRGLTKWYVYDGLGSVVGEVDPSGSLTASDTRYDVYGAVRARAGTPSTAHGFVGGLGHLSDKDTGLVYMRAR